MKLSDVLLLVALFMVAFVILAGVATLPGFGGMPSWARVAGESSVCAVAAFALALVTPRR